MFLFRIFWVAKKWRLQCRNQGPLSAIVWIYPWFMLLVQSQSVDVCQICRYSVELQIWKLEKCLKNVITKNRWLIERQRKLKELESLENCQSVIAMNCPISGVGCQVLICGPKMMALHRGIWNNYKANWGKNGSAPKCSKFGWLQCTV